MSFTALAKSTSTFVEATKNKIITFLLKQDEGYLLLETGGKIILKKTVSEDSKNSSSWTGEAKS